MSEPSKTVGPDISEIIPPNKGEIVGLRVLGTVDPRTLTREQFLASPDLLFHGATNPFEFAVDFDFESAGTEGSATFGLGFYTVDDKQAAEDYAQVRIKQTRGKVNPTVVELLPFQAKMLDLRSKLDMNINGNFPYNFTEKWKEKFNAYMVTRPETEDRIKRYLYESEDEYKVYLEEIVKANTPIHPRVLLDTHIHKFMGPPWSKLFSDFMVEQGYDGAIIVEASEKDNKTFQPSYVFYTMRKIGTYGTWQKRK